MMNQTGNLGMNFDANQVAPNEGSSQLPVGVHKVQIESSEIKQTQSGQGGFLQLNMRILEGEHAGTTGADRLNIHNQNMTAVEIAYRTLSAYCHATGQMVIQDSSQLHNIPFCVEVGQQKNNPDYTEVKKVLNADGSPVGKARQQPQQQVQQQGGNSNWQGQQQQQAPPQQMQQQNQAPPQQQGGNNGWGQQNQQNWQPPSQQAPPPQQGTQQGGNWQGQQQQAPPQQGGRPHWMK